MYLGELGNVIPRCYAASELVKILDRDTMMYMQKEYNIYCIIIIYGLYSALNVRTIVVVFSKDDATLSLGETLKKIIVPHPALQGFNRVQITYTAYKGWLSNGLSKWSIDKFILTDSYGNR